jgi:hypothetical protein
MTTTKTETTKSTPTNNSKIPYYPGCTLKTTAKNFEKSAIAAARALGIELLEIPRWNCCGTVFSLADDDLWFGKERKSSGHTMRHVFQYA